MGTAEAGIFNSMHISNLHFGNTVTDLPSGTCVLPEHSSTSGTDQGRDFAGQLADRQGISDDCTVILC